MGGNEVSEPTVSVNLTSQQALTLGHLLLKTAQSFIQEQQPQEEQPQKEAKSQIEKTQPSAPTTSSVTAPSVEKTEIPLKGRLHAEKNVDPSPTLDYMSVQELLSLWQHRTDYIAFTGKVTFHKTSFLSKKKQTHSAVLTSNFQEIDKWAKLLKERSWNSVSFFTSNFDKGEITAISAQQLRSALTMLVELNPTACVCVEHTGAIRIMTAADRASFNIVYPEYSHKYWCQTKLNVFDAIASLSDFADRKDPSKVADFLGTQTKAPIELFRSPIFDQENAKKSEWIERPEYEKIFPGLFACEGWTGAFNCIRKNNVVLYESRVDQKNLGMIFRLDSQQEALQRLIKDTA